MKKATNRYSIGAVWRARGGWFWVGALITWLGIFLFSALLVYILPQLYVGTIRMEIVRESQPYEVFRENSTKLESSLVDHESFMRNEVMILTSKETLYKVIEELQLVKRWEDAKTQSDAYQNFLDRIDVFHQPGTSIVDVSVRHTDPVESADLANAIGRAYQARRNQIETSRSNAALDMLNAQETLQEQKVEDARIRMIELMEKFDIVDMATGSPANPAGDTIESTTHARVVEATEALNHAERELAISLTRIDTIKNLSGENRLEYFMNEGMLPPYAQRAFEEVIKLRGTLANLEESGFGAEQPEVAKTQKSITDLENVLRQANEQILRVVVTKEKIEVESFEKLKSIVENLRDRLMQERKSYTQYVESRRAYESLNRILTEMREALMREKVDLSLPRSPIVLHEVAEPNETPDSENILAALKEGALTGLMWAIPGGLLLLYVVYAWTTRGPSAEFDEADYYEVDEETQDVPEAIEVSSEEDRY